MAAHYSVIEESMSDAPAKSAKLRTQALRRLKLADASLKGRKAADSFIDNLAACKFLTHQNVQGGRVYLYGDEDSKKTPQYAPFVKEVTGHDVPDVQPQGYVMIIHTNGVWYAMTFGSGNLHLAGASDVEAHREIARHETMPKDPEHEVQLKQITVREPGVTSFVSQKRSNRGASLSEFGVDLYTTIFDNVVGSPQHKEKYGGAISGGETIGIRKSVSGADFMNTIVDLETTLAEAQEEHGDGFPGIAPVKNPATVAVLNEKLVAMVRDQKEGDVWLTLPYFVSSDIAPEVHFASSGSTESFPDTVTLDDYRQLLAKTKKLAQVDLDFLRTAAMIVEGEKARFPLIRCLGAHVELEGRVYIHDERLWYVVPRSSQEVIDQQLEILDVLPALLPGSDKTGSEHEYNKKQNKGDWLMLDRENAIPFRGEKPIEICDLINVVENRLTFVHVKRDFSSNQLSHLFNQGKVSAGLLFERAARDIYVEKMRQVAKARDGQQPRWLKSIDQYLGAKFSPSRISVVYAILGQWGDKPTLQRLPFFSKRTLVTAAQELRGRDFRVAVAAIEAPPRSA